MENRAEAFKIKLAGKVILIEPLYDYLREYCQGYETDETEEFVVRTEEEDIIYEREKSAREDELAGIKGREYSSDYLETLAVYRKIAEKLLDYDILLYHGSVIAVDGEGYLFTAKSGTGKSTHTNLWRKKFGERAVMINDDKPFLQMTDKGVVVYGTPWAGKHNLNTNMSVPLKAICVLNRGIENHIEQVSPKAIYGMLMQQVYRPTKSEPLLKTMKLIDKLMQKTNFYSLYCNMDPEAATVAYEGMNQEM